MKIVECAIRDFTNLSHPTTTLEGHNYSTACAFLFEDGYLIDYGGEELSLERILELVGDLDVEWLRRKVLALAEARGNRPIVDENPLVLIATNDG